MEFWQAFADYAFSDSKFSEHFKKRKAQPQHWYDLALGKSDYHLGLTVNTQKKRIGVEIYINEDKNIFSNFKEQKEEIEKYFGAELEWIEASKACRIFPFIDF